MFKYNFKYEWRSLARDRWILSLSILLLALCLFAAYNGQQKVDKRMQDIQQANKEVQTGDLAMQLLIDSIEAGLPVDVPSWRQPVQPTAVGNYHPRVAALPAAPLALVATGQSDLFTHYVKPTLSGEAMLLSFTELSSPVQLLFGSFDLSFVLIYLLPLIVIAFTYNILSVERERGSLRLLATQPIQVVHWVLQKSALRFVLLSFILGICLKLSLMMSGISILASWKDGVSQLLALSFAYLLFWFALAFLVNLMGRSSAFNALGLLGFWVGLVLLVPAMLNQLANTVYPVPSRARMINDMRVLKAQADKEQDKILTEYLRNHPELVSVEAGGEATAYGWWQRYFASQDVIKEKMQPLVAEYDGQLERQQQWVHQFRILSPAILMQDGLQNIAGTASWHYRDYRQQVIAFAEKWRTFFIPLVFKNEKVNANVLSQLPEFEYEQPQAGQNFGANLVLILLYSGLLGGLGFGWYSRRQKEEVLMA